MTQDEIDQIGKELCRCGEKCAGIRNDQTNGYIPRGLNFEAGDALERGTLICGINPGRSKENERKFFLSHDRNYSALTEYWNNTKDKNKYFTRPRRLVRGLGFSGPIVWTDLVKCENHSKEEKLSFDSHARTFRNCTSRFLLNELKIIPTDWLVVCLGRDTFRVLTFLCSDRPTLGIPHPAGPYSPFPKFFSGDGALKGAFKEEILDYFCREPRGALWITPNR